jgi:hypothetical protein
VGLTDWIIVQVYSVLQTCTNQSKRIECINLCDESNVSNSKQYAPVGSLEQFRGVFQVGGDVAKVGGQEHRIHASGGIGSNATLFGVERLRFQKREIVTVSGTHTVNESTRYYSKYVSTGELTIL